MDFFGKLNLLLQDETDQEEPFLMDVQINGKPQVKKSRKDAQAAVQVKSD